MKVTKAIREYVENQIRAKSDESLAELEKRATDAERAYKKDREAACETCSALYNELYNGLVDKHNLTCGHTGRGLHLPEHTYFLPDVIAYHQARNKAYGKINTVVTEILATMELGGTKAELLEMINNVTF